MRAERRRVLLAALAVVGGVLWWWSALRLVLGPSGTGLLEGSVVAGGWGLSLLPVHCVPASLARTGRGVAEAADPATSATVRTPRAKVGVAWQDRTRLCLRRHGVAGTKDRESPETADTGRGGVAAWWRGVVGSATVRRTARSRARGATRGRGSGGPGLRGVGRWAGRLRRRARRRPGEGG